MTKKKRIYLVIDADVAQAAPRRGAPTGPRSTCRDFLVRIKEICHGIAVSEAILDEWDRHGSPFFQKWRGWMYRKGKLKPATSAKHTKLLDAAKKAALSVTELAAFEKDVHLVAAALGGDCIVVSLDETMRELVARVAIVDHRLARILWLNPEREHEHCVEQAKRGFPARPGRPGARAS